MVSTGRVPTFRHDDYSSIDTSSTSFCPIGFRVRLGLGLGLPQPISAQRKKVLIFRLFSYIPCKKTLGIHYSWFVCLCDVHLLNKGR